MPGRGAQTRGAPFQAHAILAYAVAGLVFLGHLAVGANRTNLALAFSVLWFALLAGLLSTQAWARRGLDEARLWPAAAAFALLLLAAGLSLTPLGIGGAHPIWTYVPAARATVSLDPYATLVEIIKLAALAAAFLVGLVISADDDRAKGLLRAILTVGLGFTAWAFIDHVINPATLYGGLRPFGADRLSAAFGSGNTAATLFGALTLLGLVDLVRSYESVRPTGRFHARHIQRMAPKLTRPLLMLGLAATCLILTQSRAGMAATGGAGIALIGALTLSRSRPTAVSVPAIATILVVGGLLVGSVALNATALERRFLFFSADSLTRTQIFAAHWAAFQAAPWSGYGLGAFGHVNTMIMNDANLSALDAIGAAHDVYIQWLEEAGVLGAAPMLALIAIIAFQLVMGVVRRRRMRSWLLGIVAVTGLFALHGASDYALQTPSMALFFSLLLGAGVGIASRRRAAKAPQPKVVPTARGLAAQPGRGV
jgi:O-antigen ligase